ncbi:MAG: class I SAM-dependent methyltransferase [Planctomycetes bacterium]|nr:class I SAM-dependent methyltransferase [Planctomycetota bacterium]
MDRTTRRIESLVAFRNSQNVRATGTLVHLTRNLVVFEVYNPYSIVQLSEVLSDFRVMRGERVVYSGRAVVSNLVSTGLMLIVSATLVDPWSDLLGLPPGDELEREVGQFVSDWEASHKLLPEYQLSVTTISSFLSELSRWVGQLEVETRDDPASRSEQEHAVVQNLKHSLSEKILALFGHFEEVAGHVCPQEEVQHKAFAQRELHPLMLISPFVHRTYTKPLGYAGDYEMVNMILRNGDEGPNIYSRIVNAFVLAREPAEAHRNRIDFLVDLLKAEAARAERAGRKFRVLNIGCGPARETERFIREFKESERGEFTLLDFNEETLDYTRSRLGRACSEAGRWPSLSYMHKSIHELLKESSRGEEPAQQWDLVFCAGLFDYLSDKICKRLLQLFYAWTVPGGSIAATNVHSNNPIRLFMEHLLEWYLIYRDEAGFESLVPAEWKPRVSMDRTGVNVYLVADKPEKRRD